jgi:metal-responsive CopG/Arc/MetJ family transcriptional regulator
MARLSLRLPEELESKLDDEARREGVARSEIARTAIAEFLERKERERYTAAFVAEARAAYTDPKIRKEALALAEEAFKRTS